MPEAGKYSGVMKGLVMANRKLKGPYWLLELNMDSQLSFPQPGRFLMFKVSSTTDPLLRRPFGIHDFVVDEDGSVRLKILYRVCGRGTGLMTGFAKGKTMDILGPLGVGFEMPENGREPAIVAGGIGGAPLLYLARRMIEKGFSPKVYIGGDGAHDILGVEEFMSLGIEVEKATMDGSLGFKGTVVDLFLKKNERADNKFSVYACGPWRMLGSLAGACDRNGWHMQATVDSYMACGMGLCLGCAVKKPGGKGYVMVCRDGPVFNLGDIEWCNPT